MKVFISHSSKDKWAARRIAGDIESLGGVVFIDEKDIKTGQSIDSEIRNHLVDSDHFLILLSPASIGSDWVLLELGGALALSKTIIPILLYVGSNEIPQAINLKLARDINEIDKYYEEIESLIDNKPLPKRKVSTKKRSASSLKKGVYVRIATNEPPVVYRDEGLDTPWIEEMDKYLGSVGKVTGVDEDGDYKLDIDDGDYAWAREWLIPVERP